MNLFNKIVWILVFIACKPLSFHKRQPESGRSTETAATDQNEPKQPTPFDPDPPIVTDPTPGQSEDNSTVDAITILTNKCQSCHNPSQAMGNFSEVTDVDAMINSGTYVVPGSPEKSSIYRSLPPTGNMPPGGDFSTEEKLIIEQWILSLAETELARTTINTESELTVIANHVSSNQAAETTLYFTLRKAHNSAISNQILENIRSGFKKALNSLSRNPKMLNPEPIDPDRTIYPVDISKLNTSVERFNGVISGFYPFHLQYLPGESPQSKQLAELDKSISALSKRTPYLIEMDWMVSTMMLPPLYHRILGLDRSIEVLEQRLGVQRLGNIAEGKVIRSGFRQSGVSFNNRMIERHSSQDEKFFWISYDFADSRGDHDILQHPLGPIDANLDQDLSFIHDGGEVIYELPNGMLGFYLTDFFGIRLNKAPQAIVAQQGGPDILLGNIVNGFSCSSCHHPGLLYRADEVVPYNQSMFPNPSVIQEQIASLYPPAEQFLSRMQADNQRYVAALSAIGLSPDQPDPIDASFRYYNRYLALGDVLRSLDISEDSLKLLINNNPLLALALQPLLAGGSISRFDLNRLWHGIINLIPERNAIEMLIGDVIVTPKCISSSDFAIDDCLLTPQPITQP